VNLIILPMAFLGGAFIPLAFAPQWIVNVSYVMPLRYLVIGMQNVMARGDGPASALPAMGLLLAFAAVLTLIAVRCSGGTKYEPVSRVSSGLPTTPSGRDLARPARGAEGATSPEPLRHQGPDGTGVSGVVLPGVGGDDRGGGPQPGDRHPVAPSGGSMDFASRHIGPSLRAGADARGRRLLLAGRAGRRRAAAGPGRHRVPHWTCPACPSRCRSRALWPSCAGSRPGTRSSRP
jgi:hypothetical protein